MICKTLNFHTQVKKADMVSSIRPMQQQQQQAKGRMVTSQRATGDLVGLAKPFGFKCTQTNMFSQTLHPLHSEIVFIFPHVLYICTESRTYRVSLHHLAFGVPDHHD